MTAESARSLDEGFRSVFQPSRSTFTEIASQVHILWLPFLQRKVVSGQQVFCSAHGEKLPVPVRKKKLAQNRKPKPILMVQGCPNNIHKMSATLDMPLVELCETEPSIKAVLNAKQRRTLERTFGINNSANLQPNCQEGHACNIAKHDP